MKGSRVLELHGESTMTTTDGTCECRVAYVVQRYAQHFDILSVHIYNNDFGWKVLTKLGLMYTAGEFWKSRRAFLRIYIEKERKKKGRNERSFLKKQFTNLIPEESYVGTGTGTRLDGI